MTIKKSLTAAGLVAALALTACGGGKAAGHQHDGTVYAAGTMPVGQSSAPAASPAAAAAAAVASKPAARPSPVPSGTPFPQFAPGTMPAPATATLSAACVTPGGLETLTIKTVAGYSVTFDAQYSDGKDGQRYGGFGYGYATSAGTFGGTWAVAPNAPLGKVIVWVAVAHGQYSAFRQPSFTVSRSCG